MKWAENAVIHLDYSYILYDSGRECYAAKHVRKSTWASSFRSAVAQSERVQYDRRYATYHVVRHIDLQKHRCPLVTTYKPLTLMNDSTHHLMHAQIPGDAA